MIFGQPPAAPLVVGAIIAGGRSRRLGGGDKCLLPLGGRPLLAHLIERVRPQVGALVLNANGDPARFAAFGLPVVGDTVGGFAGPLAGILSALDWTAANVPSARWVASFAADTPFVPPDLVVRLAAAVAATGRELAVAASAGRTHPVIGVWSVGLRAALRHAIAVEGVRKVDAWTARFCTCVDFPAAESDPFFNINTESDLAAAETVVAAAITAAAKGR